MRANGRAQVSMNITDFERSSMAKVYTTVCEIAERHGATLAEGELIGLIPEKAYEPNAEWTRQTVGFDPEEKVLERRLRHPLPWP